MEAKAYLSQARRVERRIEALKRRQQRFAELGALRRGQGAELDALQRELDAKIERYAALVRDISRRIDRVDNPVYREVLEYRYLDGWSWQAIAARMCFTRDWVMKLHARAIEAIEEGRGRV